MPALRRAIGRHRVLLAAGLAAGSVGAGLSVLAPEPPPTVAVVIAARDLAGGMPLVDDDVRLARVAAGAVPSAALRTVAAAGGRMLAGPVRAGEMLTDVRLVGPSLAGGAMVATPVRIADAAEVALLQVGDTIDVLAAPTGGGGAAGGPAVVAAEGVRVLAIPAAPERALADGALVVLATTPAVAADLATAAVHARLSLVVRGAR